MHVEGPFDLCVVCLASWDAAPGQPKSRTKAHVLPEALGGRLSFGCLCKECNERISRLEAKLALDPTVRHAIETLADRLPSLSGSRAKHGRRYVARSDSELFDFRLLLSGSFRLIERRAPDGTGHKNTDDARDEIRGRLTKRGADEAEIGETLARFDRGDPITVDQLTFLPQTADFEVGLPYDEDLAPSEALLAAAYLYLAGLSEHQIYDQAFDRVRATLAAEKGQVEGWSVTRVGLGTRGHAPFHRIWVREPGPPLEVVITLFGWDSWIVKFDGIALKSRPTKYVLDLETNEEHAVD